MAEMQRAAPCAVLSIFVFAGNFDNIEVVMRDTVGQADREE
jgi:hypothetical protein